MKIWNSQLLPHHACLNATMPIMDSTSEPLSQPQLNAVVLRVSLVMVSVHGCKTLRQKLVLEVGYCYDGTRSCNTKIALEIPRCSRCQSCDTCWGKLLTGWNQPRRKTFVWVNKDEKEVGDLKTTLTLDLEMQSLEFVQLVHSLALGITVWWLDESQKRLWTYNIVETAIDWDFWSWTKCNLHYVVFRCAPPPIESCVWTSLWEPGSRMWWLECAWLREWHY